MHQIAVGLIVQQELIQEVIVWDGPDATNTAEEIMVVNQRVSKINILIFNIVLVLFVMYLLS